jgi:hypothetical protein
MAKGTRGRSKTGITVIGGRERRRTREQLGLKRVDNSPVGILTKQLAGGKQRFMEFARLALQIEPDLAPVVESYESLNDVGRAAASIDAICAEHQIDPLHFIGVVGEAALKFGNNSAIVIAALSLPDVVTKSVKEALKPGGDKDRKMLFQHAQFIPTPHGTQINVQANAAARADSSSGEGKGLPSFERNMREADEVIRDRE